MAAFATFLAESFRAAIHPLRSFEPRPDEPAATHHMRSFVGSPMGQDRTRRLGKTFDVRRFERAASAQEPVTGVADWKSIGVRTVLAG